MELPDFLMLGTDGEIRVTGHRIDLNLLILKYNEGHAAEMPRPVPNLKYRFFSKID